MQSNSSRTTIQDIANALGISRNTVSKALNGHAGITEAMRSRILAKACEMNYKSMGVAAQSAPQPTKDILLICNDNQLQHSSFFLSLIQALLTEIRKRNANPIIQFIAYQDTISPSQAQPIKNAAGIIALEALAPAYISMLFRMNKPLVFFDYHDQIDFDQRPRDIVLSDPLPLKNLITHMYRKGARNFCFVGDPNHCLGFSKRYALFNEVTRQLGVTAFQASQDDALNNPLTDAFVCANDYIALGVMKELSRIGKRIPDDVQICGFDGIEDGQHFTPALSTVSVHFSSLAANLSLLLFDRIANPTQDSRTLLSQSTVTFRETLR